MSLSRLKRYQKFITILVLFGLALWFFWTQDIVELGYALSLISPLYLALLVVLQLITISLIALQWRLLGFHLKHPLSYKEVLEMNVIGQFVESVTPAVKSGGEASKFIFLKYKGYPSPLNSALIAMQKLLSFVTFSICLLGVLIWAIASNITIEMSPYIYGFLFFIGLLMIVWLSFYILKKQSFVSTKIKRFIETLSNHLKKLKKRKFLWVEHLLLGLMIWGLYVFKVQLISDVYEIDIPIIISALAIFTAYVIGMLPLTPGGIGSFEAAFVSVFVAFNIATSVALSIVLTVRLVTFWFSLLLSGIYVLLYKLLTKEGSIET